MNTMNATVLEAELAWFYSVLERRIEQHFAPPSEQQTIITDPPTLDPEQSFYADLVAHYELGPAERLVLMLALVPHVRPELLDVLFTKNTQTDMPYTQFGGLDSDGPFLPTVETALFILAGDNLADRFFYQQFFDTRYVLREHGILMVERVRKGDHNRWRLDISPDIRDLVTTGVVKSPDYGADFPAKRITTGLDWEDLILDAFTMDQLAEIKAWFQHGTDLMMDACLSRQLKPGFRSLFYGPPGTGKTLSASLLGKYSERDVYRIDLAAIISKYIGETEKNLEKVFTQAEKRDWIVFFDEAESLFGKRSETRSAHDRYANQEVAYLLQRIEDFPGVIILATNLKANMDEAFSRRFQSLVHFPMPAKQERRRLWQLGFGGDMPKPTDTDLRAVADQHEIAGGSIINVVRWCTLMALHRKQDRIDRALLDEGIRREFLKEGRTI